MAGTIQQQQLQRFFEILQESKLISELPELSNLTADHFTAIQSGAQDAHKIRIPVLRGKLGTYNAATQTPLIGNSTGVEGDSYIVSVGGTVDFGNGNITLAPDEVIEFQNGKWRKFDRKQYIEFYQDFETEKPDEGSESVLYVDLTTFSLHLWDAANAKFEPTGGAITAQAIENALGYVPANDADLADTNTALDLLEDTAAEAELDILDLQQNKLDTRLSNTPSDLSEQEKQEFKDKIGAGGGASRIPYSFTAAAGQQTFTLPEGFFDIEIQVGNSPLAPTQYTTNSPDFTILDTLSEGAEVFVWYWKAALPNAESYTKAESEERFAKVIEKTQTEYDALADAGTLEQAFYFTT